LILSALKAQAIGLVSLVFVPAAGSLEKRFAYGRLGTPCTFLIVWNPLGFPTRITQDEHGAAAEHGRAQRNGISVFEGSGTWAVLIGVDWVKEIQSRLVASPRFISLSLVRVLPIYRGGSAASISTKANSKLEVWRYHDSKGVSPSDILKEKAGRRRLPKHRSIPALEGLKLVAPGGENPVLE
jgi:hypothetical protein